MYSSFAIWKLLTQILALRSGLFLTFFGSRSFFAEPESKSRVAPSFGFSHCSSVFSAAVFGEQERQNPE